MGVSRSRTEGYQANELSDTSLNTSGGGMPSTIGTTTDKNQDTKLPLTEAQTVQPDEQVMDDDAQKVQMPQENMPNVNRNGEENAGDMAGGYGNSSGSQHQSDGDENEAGEGSGNEDEEFGKSNDNDEMDFDDDKIKKDKVEA